MPFKYQRTCQNCGKQEVNDISSHLFYVPNLDSADRKSWLKLTKHRTMNTVYKHLSSKIGKETEHPYSVKQSRTTMKNIKNKKQQQNQE